MPVWKTQNQIEDINLSIDTRLNVTKTVTKQKTQKSIRTYGWISIILASQGITLNVTHLDFFSLNFFPAAGFLIQFTIFYALIVASWLENPHEGAHTPPERIAMTCNRSGN